MEISLRVLPQPPRLQQPSAFEAPLALEGFSLAVLPVVLLITVLTRSVSARSPREGLSFRETKGKQPA